MTQHTPGPLTAKKARTIIHIAGEGPVCEISVSANHIHEDYPGCKRDYVARQEANAERIVHCWNSHDKLLEMLERVANTLEAYMKDAGDIDDPTLEEALKIIAKARGQA